MTTIEITPRNAVAIEISARGPTGAPGSGGSGGSSTFVGLSDTPGTITADGIAVGNAGGTALEFVAALAIAQVSGLQTALDGKESAGAVATHAAISSGVHGISAYGATLVDDADAAAARTTLGLGSAAVEAASAFQAAGNDDLATLFRPEGAANEALRKRMYRAGDVVGVSISLEAADSGVLRLRVLNDAGTITSEGTATVTADDSDAPSLAWNVLYGTGAFVAGDRIELEILSGFTVTTWAEFTVYGTRS